MAFEVFTKRMARAGDRPYVTIQRKGIIAFNHAAYTALGEPKAVIFLFDRDTQVVGFRAADPGEEHAYGVRPNTKRTSHLVSGTLFTRYYGIPTDVARRWLGRVNEDRVLTIDLNESPHEVLDAEVRPTDSGSGRPSSRRGQGPGLVPPGARSSAVPPSQGGRRGRAAGA
jgi:hypothetical protein